MKLRNKKTGEIGNFCYGYTNELCVSWQKDDGFWAKQEYTSLAELNEEWEDVEEPKEHYWVIDEDGVLVCRAVGAFVNEEMCKQIGNYFTTEEEAEKAVERLRAWKRLKDKGFRFNRWTIPEEPKTPHIKLVIEAEMDVPDSPYDLDLLFGGEE